MVKIWAKNGKNLSTLYVVKSFCHKSVASIILNGQTIAVSQIVKKKDADACCHCSLFHGVTEFSATKIRFLKKVP